MSVWPFDDLLAAGPNGSIVQRSIAPLALLSLLFVKDQTYSFICGEGKQYKAGRRDGVFRHNIMPL